MSPRRDLEKRAQEAILKSIIGNYRKQRDDWLNEPPIRKAVLLHSFFRKTNAALISSILVTAGCATFLVLPAIDSFTLSWIAALGAVTVLALVLVELLFLYLNFKDEDLHADAVADLFKEEVTFEPAEIQDEELKTKVDKALEYWSLIDDEINKAPKGILRDNSPHAVTHQEVTHWLQAVHTLAEHVDTLRVNKVVQQDLDRIPKIIAKYKTELETATDPEVRRQLERTISDQERQLKTLQTLTNNMDKANYQLDSTISSLGTIYSQLLLVGSKDESGSKISRLQEEISEQVHQLEDITEAMDEVYRSLHLMTFKKSQISLLVALLFSNAIILYDTLDIIWLRLPAALALTFILPGGAWLPALGWLNTNRALERLVLIGGLSSLFSALALFITVLLPGPFTEMPPLVALNLVAVAGLAGQSFWPRNPGPNSGSGLIEWPPRTVLLILIAILAVASFTRLTNLGYAEFHEDALENMRLIVRAYKGEEYAPYLDSKGPIHWLLPAALWFLNGWLTEGIARTPFAVTALLLVPAMYALGRRMSHEHHAVGLMAAGFVTVNGFYVAYARHVENPSLIVFWGTLAMWFAYRYYREERPQFLLWMALALAIGLITHPDVLLYLPVFGYIIGLKIYRDRSTWLRQWPWLLGGGLLFVALVGLFYVPYLTDPNIGAVGQYFADDRIGRSLFYNRVDNLFDQDKLYSSRYHAPVLVLLLTWLLMRNFAKLGRRGWITLAVLGLAILSTLVWPQLWIIGPYNLAFGPYALLTLAVLLLPETSFEIKTIFLWMSVPLGALLFLAKDAADHIQVAYTAWALLSAFALADLWNCLGPATHRKTGFYLIAPPAQQIRPAVGSALKFIMILSLAVIISLILFYQHLAFLLPVTRYWQAKADSAANPNSIYNWIYGSVPRPRKIFSNPRLGGWKAVGYLWESGVLSGDFRSINESFAAPIWYTFQTPRSCYTDPENYWLRRDWKGWPEEEQGLEARGYSLTRIVLVDQQPKLHLYQKNASAAEPEVIDLEDFRHQFDRLATPSRFARAETINQDASLNFGDKLLLRGYNLPSTVQAGEMLPLTLFWEGLSPMDIRYRAFIHLVDANDNRYAQHDDDPACRLLTTEMRPGQKSSRQFRLPVDPATPTGTYLAILGIYHPDTFDRLDIWDNQARNSPGNSIVLGSVEVENFD